MGDIAFSEGLTITRTSTAERVAAALREMIVQGQLQPGTPLREALLAHSSGVSRNTVREAIKILVHEGLVTHLLHRGAVVAELSEEDVSDFYRVRLLIELAGIDASADATEEQLGQLKGAITELERAGESKDPRKIVEQDLLFHRRIVDLLGSRRLGEVFQNIQGELRFCLSILSEADREYEDPGPTIAEHRAVYAALVDGRVDEARELLRRHLTSNEQRLREILRASRAPAPSPDGR